MQHGIVAELRHLVTISAAFHLNFHSANFWLALLQCMEKAWIDYQLFILRHALPYALSKLIDRK